MKKAFFLLFISLPALAWSQDIDSLNSVLQFHIVIKDTPAILSTVKPLANALRTQKRYLEASEFIYTGLEYASSPDTRLNLLNLLGQSYIEMTDYDSAMSQYKQLLLESEDAENLRYQGFALNNIGYIYYQNDELGKASEYHHRALEVRLKTGDEKRIGTSYNNIGLILFHQDSLEHALKYYHMALDMFRRAEYAWAESNVLNNIGNIYLDLGNPIKALTYHVQGLNIRERDDDLRGIAESYKNIARIYIQQSRFELAEHAIETGMSSAIAIGSRHLIKEFYLLRYEIADKKGYFRHALSSYIKYTHISDSLTGLESQNRIAELEIQYESEKREQQIEILDRDNKIANNELKNRTYMLSGLIILFILAVVILFLLFIQNRLKASLRIEQQKQRLLRSQMNPHFMFNALSAIQNFILQNNPMDSVSYISEFSGLMRLVLEGSRSDMVTLADDIKLVSSYLKLQQLRFDNAFKYAVQVHDGIITEAIKIPALLSQPFIENAVEHGMRNLLKEGLILVNYSIENNFLKVEISDNGAGINGGKERQKTHHSLATTITKERIENIKMTLDIRIKMEIDSQEGIGTKVIFLIPQKSISK